jgi:hypothetical protein
MKSTRSLTTGYVILGLLGLSDALGFILSGGDDGPPFILNLIGTLLGLATLYALFTIFRSRRAGGTPPRTMVLTVVVTRALSAVLGIPAFFVDIPGAIKVIVAVSILLTIAGLALIRPDIDAARASS